MWICVQYFLQDLEEQCVEELEDLEDLEELCGSVYSYSTVLMYYRQSETVTRTVLVPATVLV